MVPRVSAKIPEKNAHAENLAATGAAVDSKNAPIDDDLRAIIQVWPDLDLSDAVKVGIVSPFAKFVAWVATAVQTGESLCWLPLSLRHDSV